MSAGRSLLVVDMAEATVVGMAEVGVQQLTAQDGVAIGGQAGGVATMALAMVTLMQLLTIHHQWCTQCPQ